MSAVKAEPAAFAAAGRGVKRKASLIEHREDSEEEDLFKKAFLESDASGASSSDDETDTEDDASDSDESTGAKSKPKRKASAKGKAKTKAKSKAKAKAKSRPAKKAKVEESPDPGYDLSSATEQRTKRQRQRAAHNAKKASRAPSPPRQVLVKGAVDSQKPEQKKALIRDMAQLGADFGHLCTDITCTERCLGASRIEGEQKKAPGDTVDLLDDTERKEDPMSRLGNSDVQMELEKILARLPKPTLYSGTGAMTQEESAKLLWSGSHTVSEFKASHTQELLREAGRFMNPRTGVWCSFPACGEGKECILLRTWGFPGTALLFPSELEFLLKFGYCPSSVNLKEMDGEQKGETPESERECFACYSLKMADLYYNLQRVAEREATLAESTVVQICYNPVGVEDGFDTRYCLLPHSKANRFVGLHGPLLEMQAAFPMSIDVKAQRRFVDITSALWRAPSQETAVQGQSVAASVFWSGVGTPGVRKQA